MNKWFLLILIALPQLSCNTTRILDIANLTPITVDSIAGTSYQSIWNVNGNYDTIHLYATHTYRRDFNNCVYQGYEVGSYSLHGHLLTLKTDSIIQEKWTDLIDENEIVKRAIDTSKTAFIVNEKGLHCKEKSGHYNRLPAFIKIGK